jgi:hypothetical protein
MHTNKRILNVTGFALALNLVASLAQAESRSYVVSLFVPAMNNSSDSDCPEGKNPNAAGILRQILTDQGKSKEEIDKLLASGTFNNGVYSQYAPMRGQIDGKAVNVYSHPLSVPEQNIKLAVMKEAYGFNLDGTDGPDKFTDPQTHETGVNNAAARAFGCFDRTRGTLETPPTNWSVHWDYYTYGNTWLVDIDSNGGFENADQVEVSIYRGMQPLVKNAQGYQRYMTYEKDPDPRLQSNHFKGRIKDGMFISDKPSEFYMISSTRLQPEFDFKQARLRITFRPDGSLEGIMGGFLPIKMVYFPFGVYASSGEFNAGMNFPGLYQALRRLADTDIDKDAKTGTRTRISQTYLMRAVPAYVLPLDQKVAAKTGR